MILCVINAGSSSVKFSIYETSTELTLIEQGQAAVRDRVVHVEANQADGSHIMEIDIPLETEHDRVMVLLSAVADVLTAQTELKPDAVVHRVVHGGDRFHAPVVIDSTVREALNGLIDLAPLHQPVNLAGIDTFQRAYPSVPHIACFDTAFHAGQSALETTYALPRELTQQGIRKYGFHGLSYQSICQQLDELYDATPKRVVICHLGNGASICAVENGRSIASTMGFTAVEGLPMGTRSGRLDPGVILHLQTHSGYSTEAIEHLLYQEGGLKGLSGISSDMRTLEQSMAPEARFAREYFAYRINAEIGSLTAILGGLDVLVFTGGIGEHSSQVRAGVIDRLSRWLPVSIDPAANTAHQQVLDDTDSEIRVLCLESRENAHMASAAQALLASTALPQ